PRKSWWTQKPSRKRARRRSASTTARSATSSFRTRTITMRMRTRISMPTTTTTRMRTTMLTLNKRNYLCLYSDGSEEVVVAYDIRTAKEEAEALYEKQ